MWWSWGGVDAPGDWRGWRWREGREGRGALTQAGGCMTCLLAVQGQAGSQEVTLVGTGRSP